MEKNPDILSSSSSGGGHPETATAMTGRIPAAGEIIRFLKISLAVSLILHILAAIYSIGFFHYDEHYQILEFAGLKAGYTTPHDLPWEYAAHIRPAIQPMLAYWAIRLFGFFGIMDPFRVAMLLRIVSGILGWLSMALLSIALLPAFSSKWVKKTFILLSNFLWFLLFVHVRNSSESWSGSLCFIGIALLLLNKPPEGWKYYKNLPALLLAGFLFGLSFVFRFQTAFLLPGLFLWLLLIGRMRFSQLCLMGLTAVAAIGLGFVIDHWYYGEWVNTAYRYYDANIVQGKAASFGVFPWWWYLNWFFHNGLLPFNLLLMASVFIAWLRYPKDMLLWACLPFLLLHFAIGHKELRFLFPMMSALPWFMGLSLNLLDARLKKPVSRNLRLAGRILAGGIIIINLVYLQNIGFRSLQAYLKPMDYAYNHFKKEEVNLAIADSNAYGELTNLKMNFYLRKNIHLKLIDSAAQLQQFVANSRLPVLLMLSGKGYALPQKMAGLHTKPAMLYSVYPLWLKDLDFNHWAERTTFWRLYRFPAPAPSQR
jgi:phosphatidylinositol glycan class B